MPNENSSCNMQVGSKTLPCGSVHCVWCVCVCVRVCVYVCVHVCKYACMSACMYVCMYRYVGMCACMRVCVWCVCVRARARACVRACVRARVRACVRARARVCVLYKCVFPATYVEIFVYSHAYVHLSRCSFPKGPCTQIVYTLAPMYLYIGSTLRPKYILLGHMDP